MILCYEKSRSDRSVRLSISGFGRVDTFHRLAPMMKMYNIYIQYNDFMNVFQDLKANVSKFRRFVRNKRRGTAKCDDKTGATDSRYKLILRDLQKHLPSDDKLHVDSKEAIELVSEAADAATRNWRNTPINFSTMKVKIRFSGKLKKFNENPKRVVIKRMLEKIGGFGYFQDRVLFIQSCLAYGKGKAMGKVNIRNVLNFGTFEVFRMRKRSLSSRFAFVRALPQRRRTRKV